VAVLSKQVEQLKADGIKAKATKIEATQEGVRTKLLPVQDRVAEVGKEITSMPELLEAMRVELSSVRSKADAQNLRLNKILTGLSCLHSSACQQEFQANESKRMELAAKLRICIEAKGGKAEDLFKTIAGEDSDEMTKEEIWAFLEEHKCDIQREKLDALFPDMPAQQKDNEHEDKAKTSNSKKKSSAPIITKEQFTRVMRIFYKVVKEIVLSNSLLIDQSSQLRRMDVGEVMEVLQGPMLDPSVGVYRINGKALKDAASGWVTVAGNQGITFLLPGGNVFKVVAPTVLAEDSKDTEGKVVVHQLKVGQILEVLEWTRTSRSALGVTRIKGKVQGHGAVGWATVMGSNGTKYLEPT